MRGVVGAVMAFLLVVLPVMGEGVRANTVSSDEALASLLARYPGATVIEVTPREMAQLQAGKLPAGLTYLAARVEEGNVLVLGKTEAASQDANQSREDNATLQRRSCPD